MGLTSAARSQSFVIGVCTHFGQNKGKVQENLALIQRSGAGSIRDEIFWQGVEHQKGQYSIPQNSEYYVTAALELGIKPLISLDYGNPFYEHGDKPISDEAVEGYARYAEFIVRHFKGRVSMYEIWNEWNGGVGKTTPGTAESYARVLKVVYPRLKAIDSKIVVIAGAVSGGGVRGPWLLQMLEAGALTAADAISFHQYIFSSGGRGRAPEALVENIQKVEDLARKFNGGHDFPLYLTETGWPTHTGPAGTPPDESGYFLAQTMLLAQTLPYLKGVWWYDFQDDGQVPDNPEKNFGIVRADLTPKPGYSALSEVTRWMHGAEVTSRVRTSDPLIDGVRFRTSDGSEGVAIWSQGPGSGHIKIKGVTAATSLENIVSSVNSMQHTGTADLQVTEAPTWFTGNQLDVQ
jgi:polysaccharide biosynthesis protein PslG